MCEASQRVLYQVGNAEQPPREFFRTSFDLHLLNSGENIY